jgi:hypothetical protein
LQIYFTIKDHKYQEEYAEEYYQIFPNIIGSIEQLALLISTGKMRGFAHVKRKIKQNRSEIRRKMTCENIHKRYLRGRNA